MQAVHRLRALSRVTARLGPTPYFRQPAVQGGRRLLSTSSDDGSTRDKPRTPADIILSRLLKGRDGRQNPILSALGFYSPESRAIGAGNALYKVALKRADEAASVEAGESKDFAPRFEMLSVHVYLTLRRLRAEKGSPFEAEVKTVMQCLFDVFWTDVRTRMIMQEHGMNLIQSGKWIKDCEQTFFGMALAFDEAWEDDQKMSKAIARNVTCLKSNDSRVNHFRRYMIRERAKLDKTTVEQIWKGICWEGKYPLTSST